MVGGAAFWRPGMRSTWGVIVRKDTQHVFRVRYHLYTSQVQIRVNHVDYSGNNCYIMVSGVTFVML
jgi:hypothetical protein